MWVVMWNLGSQSGKGGEICEELKKKIDVLLAGGEMERSGC